MPEERLPNSSRIEIGVGVVIAGVQLWFPNAIPLGRGLFFLGVFIVLHGAFPRLFTFSFWGPVERLYVFAVLVGVGSVWVSLHVISSQNQSLASIVPSTSKLPTDPPQPIIPPPKQPILHLTPSKTSAVPIIAAFAEHVEHPTGFLQFDKPELANQYRQIGEGKQFGVNFRSINKSSERVVKTYGFTGVYVEYASHEGETNAISKATEIIVKLRAAYVSGEIKGPEVGAMSNGIWGTSLVHPLSKEEAEGIIFRTKRLYYVSWLAWTDLQRRIDWSDDCRWLQMPDFDPTGKAYEGPLIWHFCER